MFADHQPSMTSPTELEKLNNTFTNQKEQSSSLPVASSPDEIDSDHIATSVSPSSSSLLSLSENSSRENLNVFDTDRRSSSDVPQIRDEMKPLHSTSSSIPVSTNNLTVKPLQCNSDRITNSGAKISQSVPIQVSQLTKQLNSTTNSAKEEKQSLFRKSFAVGEDKETRSPFQPNNNLIPPYNEEELDDMLTVSSIGITNNVVVTDERPAQLDTQNKEADGWVEGMANVPSEPLVVSEDGASFQNYVSIVSDASCLSNPSSQNQSDIIVNGDIETNECEVIVRPVVGAASKQNCNETDDGMEEGMFFVLGLFF